MPRVSNHGRRWLGTSSRRRRARADLCFGHATHRAATRALQHASAPLHTIVAASGVQRATSRRHLSTRFPFAHRALEGGIVTSCRRRGAGRARRRLEANRGKGG